MIHRGSGFFSPSNRGRRDTGSRSGWRRGEIVAVDIPFVPSNAQEAGFWEGPRPLAILPDNAAVRAVGATVRNRISCLLRAMPDWGTRDGTGTSAIRWGRWAIL